MALFCHLPDTLRQFPRLFRRTPKIPAARKHTMKAVTECSRLQELTPSILVILHVSGAAGASVGVLDGQTNQLHVAGYGYRDVEEMSVRFITLPLSRKASRQPLLLC